VRQSFSTSVGTVEVLVDEQSRVVSVYRFDAQHHPLAAAIESWDHSDLDDILTHQAGVPFAEARQIAAEVRERHTRLGSLSDRLEQRVWQRREAGDVEHAGLGLRFAAVLLDAIIVFFPLGLVVGLLSGGGYAESGDGYANAGVDVGGSAFWAVLFLGIGYYVLCESASGATLGKRIVGIRVVDEDGDHITFGAAVVRNLLRLVDGLFFYVVGALFALTSARGQRLGDRAAHTVVVRR
jgi:uncharacterized RDD family membrane protein YckC